jgi:hypothetical protein
MTIKYFYRETTDTYGTRAFFVDNNFTGSAATASV